MQVLIWLVVLVGVAQAKHKLLVNTTLGPVKGFKSDDGSYSMFLGIPYGEVDRDNPFGASHPHPKYEGTFQATDDSSVCPQIDEFTYEAVGNLDCLHLNVYVPKVADRCHKVPVLVWIFGGGFTIGYNQKDLYGPQFLVRHDVVVVAINYRVGTYGFMCLETPEVPGNQGIKDQLLALRWIKKNIGAFGGDPKKITIMGESAGSGSVEYHLYSPHKTLYHQAIMQSGTVFGPTFIQESDPVRPITIAAHFGFHTDSVSEAISFLAKEEPTKLVIASTQLGLRYRPCVEKAFEGVDSILTEHPLNLDIPKVKKIPVLVGFNSHEEIAGFANRPPEYFEDYDVFRTHFVQSFEYDGDFQEMADLARRYYIGDEPISWENRFILSDFQSDFKFNYPIQKSIHKYIDNGVPIVYQYMFSYDGDRNFVKKRFNITAPGAAHADELGYLFDMTLFTERPSAEDQVIIDQMTTMWTNFVKYGNPTPEITELLPVKWLPIANGTINYLNIDKEVTMKRRPYHDRLAFWELFYDTNESYLKAHR